MIYLKSLLSSVAAVCVITTISMHAIDSPTASPFNDANDAGTGEIVLIAQVADGNNVEPEDVIRVDMIGSLETGIVAIGGESTGTTITSGGITWELEWPDAAPDLEEFARVRVTGTLTRRAGVEIPFRWIVSVESIESANAIVEEPMDPMPAEPSFENISVNRSGGFAGLNQTVMITADGKMVDTTREEQTLTAEELAMVNEIIANADWEQIVADQGRTPNAADMFNYNFTVQTSTDTIAFSYDDGKLQNKPDLQKLLQLMFR